MNDYKLLVVEDESSLREVIVEALEGSAHEIQTATNGQEALQLLAKGTYDAILSDIGMPVMDGLTFLAEVRNRGIETPLVFLTAYGDKANIQKAIQLGANDFLDKPFTSATLCQTVVNTMQLGRQLREFDELLALCMSNTNAAPDEIERMKLTRRMILALRTKTYAPPVKAS